jgi:chromosome segregation ATPase
MKILKTVLPSITNIEQTLNTINLKMSEMETKISNIGTRVSDVEKSCSFINKEYEEQSKYIEKAKNDVPKVEKSCGTLNKEMQSLQNENDNLRCKILDLEVRSMSNNLMFSNIPENSSENCENVIKQFIRTELETDPTNNKIERAYINQAIASPQTKKPRPIVVNFHNYTDDSSIRQSE